MTVAESMEVFKKKISKGLRMTIGLETSITWEDRDATNRNHKVQEGREVYLMILALWSDLKRLPLSPQSPTVLHSCNFKLFFFNYLKQSRQERPNIFTYSKWMFVKKFLLYHFSWKHTKQTQGYDMPKLVVPICNPNLLPSQTKYL